MKKKKNSSPQILLFGLATIVLFSGGYYLGSKDIEIGRLSDNLPQLQKEQHNGVDVSLLWEVWNTLEREHIDGSKIEDSELLYGAAKGLVSGVGDGYTAFLSPEETKEYESSKKREFQGIGTTLAKEGEYVIIESPIDGYPAQAAGLKAQDIILEVDGKDVSGKSIVEVANLIRGDAGSTVKIKYYRESSTETNEVSIVRQVIDLENMTLEELDNGILLFKIYQFTDADVATYNREWDKFVGDILKKNPKGLIVDLRNNPGGYVDAVRYSLNEFIEPGKVLFQEEDKNGNKTKYEVNRTGKLLDIPMVVLVNEGSASSSEIFAGAIQDHKRGEIIGTETVGKGVEQKLIDLSDGSMLQVVFQRWLTPNGRNLSKDDPITPDKEVLGEEKQIEEAVKILSN